MAALPDSRSTPEQHVGEEIVELRSIDADRLTPLLEEEIAAWRAELDWDFRASADLVRRFVHMQALSGFALVSNSASGPRVIGYSYYVCEEGKGLIGDLYVMRERPAAPVQPTHLRSARLENALLEAVLGAIWRMPGVKRVEAQPMMLGSPLSSATPGNVSSSSPGRARPQSYPRKFLYAPLGRFCEAAAEAARPRGHHRLDREHAGSHRAPDRRRVSGPYRQPDQRPVSIARGRPAVPDEHRAVSRVRDVLRAGVIRGDRHRNAAVARRFARKPGGQRLSATSRRSAWRNRSREPAWATN